MKKILSACLLATGVTAVQAQVTANLGLTSDYRFRGVSQTQNGLAIQGGIDYAHSSGFYVGNWNSSVSSQLYNAGAGIESDLYAGYKKEVMPGLTLDVGSMNYLYSKSSNNPAYTTNELYIGASYGPVSAKLSRSLSDYFGIANSKGTMYYQADVNHPVMDKVTLNGHVGRTDVNNNSQLSYTDWKVGATYDLNGWGIGAHYYTNTNKGSNFKAANTVGGEQLYKNTVVLSVTKTF